MRAGYRLTDPGTGRAVTVTWPGPDVAGDPGLARRIAPYLEEEAVLALRATHDPRTGERGTRVCLAERGSWDWLRECLGRAAQELDLVMVVDLP